MAYALLHKIPTELLLHLLRKETEGAMSQSEIAERLDLSWSAMTIAIKRLQEFLNITKIGTKKILSLNDKGVELAGRILEINERWGGEDVQMQSSASKELLA